MEFKEFKDLFQAHVKKMLGEVPNIFVAGISGDKLWETYLESFPEGTNEIFRERREHDCSCCRHFIRSFGNVGGLINNKIVSI